MTPDETTVAYLNYLLKTYDGTVKLLTGTKNRLCSLNKEAKPKHIESVQVFESFQGKMSRQIEKEIEQWPIWTEWLKGIPGIGPFIAGNLIRQYYYKFVPVCKKCGADLTDDFSCSRCDEKAAGGGVLQHRIEERHFPKISSFWKFMGEANDPETGRMEKRKKGVQSSWSSKNRCLSWNCGEQFNRQKPDHLYKAWCIARKEKGRKHHQAIRETRKLFLAHFIMVAKEIAGEELPAPYAMDKLGHVGLIKPFYWKPRLQ